MAGAADGEAVDDAERQGAGAGEGLRQARPPARSVASRNEAWSARLAMVRLVMQGLSRGDAVLQQHGQGGAEIVDDGAGQTVGERTAAAGSVAAGSRPAGGGASVEDDTAARRQRR